MRKISQDLIDRCLSISKLNIFFVLLLLAFSISVAHHHYNNLHLENHTGIIDSIVHLGYFVIEHMVPELLVLIIAYFLLHEGINSIAGTESVRNRPIKEILESMEHETSVKSFYSWDRTVVIYDTFINSYLQDRVKFEQTILKVIEKDFQMKIFVLDPNSLAAKQRERDLSKNEEYSLGLRTTMRVNLNELFRIKLNIERQLPNKSDNFQVYLFDSLPTFAFVKMKKTGYMSFFKPRENSTKGRTLKFRNGSHLGNLADSIVKKTQETNPTELSSIMTMGLKLSDGMISRLYFK
jgi:hypothetical protein